MLFNSVDFAIFLPIIFILYWFVFNKNLKLQNLLIVGASYYFYGCWDWRFLSLVFLSTVVDFVVGRQLASTKLPSTRKVLLWASILVNLGVLGFFKYCNFFIENFIAVFTFFDVPINGFSLHIILPVGISFYTFQSMSYTIDIYRNKLEPSNDFIAFAAFVSFFPQLVAGPIERAVNFLPQFKKPRIFEHQKAVDGMYQILCGLFKKIVIADSCAPYVEMVFNNPSDFSGSTLLIGVFLFSVQVYGDFSGYSDIAIGTGRLFGFHLMRNFAFPFFSRDIGEFWRRWHISLSTWFRDYLYIPLGGSRAGLGYSIRNVLIIFVVSGFWHGSKWTFIVWGLLNALYFLPSLLRQNKRTDVGIVAQGRLFPSFREVVSMGTTFVLISFSFIFFRSENLEVVFQFISGIISFSVFTVPAVLPEKLFWLILGLFLVEWVQRHKEHALQLALPILMKPVKWSFLLVLTEMILFHFFEGTSQEFIYFDF